MSSVNVPAATPRRNWFQRNWKWFLPVGCLGLIGLMVGFFALIFTVIMGSIKSSDAFKLAMDAARADSRVQEKLGTPLEPGWMVSGNIEVSGPGGEANLAIPISGSRGKGKLFAVGTKSAGQWTFSTLVVEVESDGSRIDLLNSDAGVQSP